MKIEHNTRIDGRYISQGVEVKESDIRIEREVGAERSSIIGRLSKYTERSDLSTLISSRDW